jgi:hypothetical protein
MQTPQRMCPWRAIALGLALLFVLGSALAAPAVEPHYFVAVDRLETLTSGTYTGLPNPNHGRLTLLVAHTDDEDPIGNHFHAIGAYSYTGPVESPAVISTNTNNRIPELSTGALPLRLLLGTGVFESRLASRPTGEEYSDLRLASIQVLSGFPGNSPEGILFHSSEGRWAAPLTDVVVALQRVSVTPGLHLADETGEEIPPEGFHPLGAGDLFTFVPVYWAEGTAPVGTYSATWKLVDVGTGEARRGESGRFTFDLRIPAPGDLDGDNDADVYDLIVIVNALGTPAAGPDDLRDLNHDGTIDALDAQLFVAQFFPEAPPSAAPEAARLEASGRPARDLRAPVPGDLDSDHGVDAADLIVIVNALGTPAAGPDDPRDLNHDGTIDAADAQRVAAQFLAAP